MLRPENIFFEGGGGGGIKRSLAMRDHDSSLDGNFCLAGWAPPPQ